MNIATALITLTSGFLFSLGLGIAGMTQPENILNFLDITGNWDWRLLLVMAGGIVVSGLAYAIKGSKPWFATGYSLAINKAIDAKLIVGTIIFGSGWGLAGFCPGPVIASLASLHWQPFVFVIAMLAGMAFCAMFEKRTPENDN